MKPGSVNRAIAAVSSSCVKGLMNSRLVFNSMMDSDKGMSRYEFGPQTESALTGVE